LYIVTVCVNTLFLAFGGTLEVRRAHGIPRELIELSVDKWPATSGANEVLRVPQGVQRLQRLRHDDGLATAAAFRSSGRSIIRRHHRTARVLVARRAVRHLTALKELTAREGALT